MRTFTSEFSFMGPRFTRKTFRIVRFVVSGRPVSASTLSLTKCRAENTLSINVASTEDFFLKTAFDGYRRPVSLSNLA